ncbi:hypothetical protein [Methylobacter tundripaludum]|uniref:hypothetical protein n=1 Tax=Methylobacter tundripaludum TaxID=173365 RepID=UPI000CEAB255|nr:hypothetical protein [Methylobacter tundripaludum]
MDKKNNLIHTLIGVALFFGIAIVGYFAFKKAIIVFSALNPEIAAGIIAASSTVFVSVITVVCRKDKSRRL